MLVLTQKVRQTLPLQITLAESDESWKNPTLPPSLEILDSGFQYDGVVSISKFVLELKLLPGRSSWIRYALDQIRGGFQHLVG